jgi:hypothetical protein
VSQLFVIAACQCRLQVEERVDPDLQRFHTADRDQREIDLVVHQHVRPSGRRRSPSPAQSRSSPLELYVERSKCSGQVEGAPEDTATASFAWPRSAPFSSASCSWIR